MNDLPVLIYENNKIKEIKLGDICRNKRVLVCSLTRVWSTVQLDYLNYLSYLESKYKSSGLDAVIILDSFIGTAQFGIFGTQLKTIIGLVDKDQTIVNYLRQRYHEDMPLLKLAKFWDYQLLLNDGRIEKFYEQPVKNQFYFLTNSNLVDDTFRLKLLKIMKFGEELIFNRRDLSYGDEQTYEFGGKLFYYQLWPNVKLETYLKGLK